MLLIDSNGEKQAKNTRRQRKVLLPQIIKGLEKDHILHRKFKFIIIKSRQLILQQDEDAKKTARKLYIALKNSKTFDKKSVYCHCTKWFFGTVYLAALIRFEKRTGEIKSRNKPVSENQMIFDEHPKHKGIPFVKNQLILFYQQNMEITSAQSGVMKTNYSSEQI